jgi:hypothetical protein
MRNRTDSTGRINFEFSKSKELANQILNEHFYPCGFSWNADAFGTFRIQSARMPIITLICYKDETVYVYITRYGSRNRASEVFF